EQWVQEYDELHFSNRQVIFEAGSSPNSFYWLTEGIVQLQSEPSPGRVFIRDLQQAPISLGLSALLAAKPQTESAISMTKGKMRVIPIGDFANFLQDKPSVMQYIIQQIASETLAQQALQSEYSFASVRKRVALSLCRIYDIFGDQEIDFPREALASFSAVSRGGLMRVLAEFREDSLVETENTKLKVTSHQALTQITD
ncbi:MAG: Crp/Fnr family transcriptional regulator, partial [Bacteroidia bacterium]